MDAEQYKAYQLARKYRAHKTSVSIRAGASVGKVQRIACDEIGPESLVSALLEAADAWWTLCALRWCTQLTEEQCARLLPSARTDVTRHHAVWVLQGMRHLGEREERMLKAVLEFSS